MRAEIISVGTELLLGDIVNTNAQFIAQELAGLGFTVYYQTVVGDNVLRLRSLVQTAKERSDILIFTGGLGPTEDDLTKETVADTFGDTLVMDFDELANLEYFFKSLGRTMTDNNRKQAMVPKHGRKLPNSNGTAPGAFFRQGDKCAFLLPGPPSEMKPMFFEQVRPILEGMQDSAIRSLTLRVFGIGESDLEHKAFSLLENTNPTAALYAKTGEVHIRITAKSRTAEQADLMCSEYAELFYDLLGDLIYSNNGDDLETTVVKNLMENSETLGTAESCTGGLLSQRITAVSGASGVFGFGACTYSNTIKHEILGVKNSALKRYGAVSSQVAAEMAFGAANRALSTYGVGITGIAGPTGGTKEKPVGLVYVAVANEKQVYVKKLQITGRGREYVRQSATQHALDMVRRLSLGLPIPGAKEFAKNHMADFEREGRPRKKGGAVPRAIAAFLVVLAALAVFLLASRFTNRPQPVAGVALPSAQGLRYGDVAYGTAARKMVAAAKEENPSVAGFLAFPEATVETLVGKTRSEQAAIFTAQPEPEVDGLALLPSNGGLFQSSSNTVLMVNSSAKEMLGFQNTENITPPSTFTYFTEYEEKVFLVYAVYLFDIDEKQTDSFHPAVLSLSSQSDYLAFVLGARLRSLYDTRVDIRENDNFLTLAASDPQKPNQILAICGRLARPDESISDFSGPVPSGSPVMPLSFYKQHKLTKPDIAELQAYWMGWYLTRALDNSYLQLTSGMPETDLIPYKPTPASSEEASSVTSEEPPESASSSSTSASSGSVSQTDSSDTQSSSAAASSKPPAPPPPQRLDAGTLTVTMNGSIVTDSTVNIVAQICQREAAHMQPEAIKAVAIAAHSWIRNQQGAGNTAPQVVGSLPSAKVLKAVEDVSRLVLSGGQQAPAFAVYSPLVANGTNTADAIWNSKRPYLISVASPQDQNYNVWRQHILVPPQHIAKQAEELLGITLDETAPFDTWITALEKNEFGYVTALYVGDKKVEGAWFWHRFLLQDETLLLNSPAFEISFDGENFLFTSYGLGHGCGMSLAGANAMAAEGKNHTDILQFYYPNTTLIEW